MEYFDDFIMVDWSARAEPITGADSIWLASLNTAKNYRTRHDFFLSMQDIIEKSIKDKKRILCGFDFSFGLPAGSVAKMRKAKNDKSGVHDWHWLWHYLNDNIKDNERNHNNRWLVASKMNRLLSGGKGPFWGCPKKDKNKYLSTNTKDMSSIGKSFKTKRITEENNKGKSVWQLLGRGSVGSQSLLGMAYLYKLRFLSDYESNIRVFPFENCDTAPIVIAESYYNKMDLNLKKHKPKDKAEVIAAVEWCRSLQEKGELKNYFPKINDERITADEGWTFTEKYNDSR